MPDLSQLLQELQTRTQGNYEASRPDIGQSLGGMLTNLGNIIGGYNKQDREQKKFDVEQQAGAMQLSKMKREENKAMQDEAYLSAPLSPVEELTAKAYHKLAKVPEQIYATRKDWIKNAPQLQTLAEIEQRRDHDQKLADMKNREDADKHNKDLQAFEDDVRKSTADRLKAEYNQFKSIQGNSDPNGNLLPKAQLQWLQIQKNVTNEVRTNMTLRKSNKDFTVDPVEKRYMKLIGSVKSLDDLGKIWVDEATPAVSEAMEAKKRDLTALLPPPPPRGKTIGDDLGTIGGFIKESASDWIRGLAESPASNRRRR